MYEENIFHLYFSLISLISNVVLGATSTLIQEHGQNKLSLLINENDVSRKSTVQSIMWSIPTADKSLLWSASAAFDWSHEKCYIFYEVHVGTVWHHILCPYHSGSTCYETWKIFLKRRDCNPFGSSESFMTVYTVIIGQNHRNKMQWAKLIARPSIFWQACSSSI